MCVAAIVSGCGRSGNGGVLARIDQKDVITRKDFDGRIAKLPKRYQDFVNKNKKEFLDELVIDKLLYKEALRKNLQNDKEVKEVYEEAQKKILIARLLKDEVEDKVVLSDEEIIGYYKANSEQFSSPEVLRASHILVKTQEEAKDVLAELSGGRNFEDLARARSIDPSGKSGGDVGYFTREQLVPEIEEACFNMQVGEISGIVKTQFGYHVIKLTERKEPRVKNLSEVRDAVEQSLGRRKKKAHFNEFVSRLKEKSKITINHKLLATISEEAPPED